MSTNPSFVRVAVAGAANPEWAIERSAQGPLKPALWDGSLRATHVVSARFLEHRDALPDVVVRIARVDVHAQDHLAHGGGDHRVHGRRLEPSRVVDDANATWTTRGDLAQDLACSVGTHAVPDEDLDPVRRVVLSEDVLQAGLDVALLVETRDGDRHERRAHRRVR